MNRDQFIRAVIVGVQGRNVSVFKINRYRVVRRWEDGDTVEQVVEGEVRMASWK